MGYPAQNSNTLTMCLGWVYHSNLAASSNALNVPGGAFVPSDVGLTVALIGAGATTPDPYKAALMTATITGYVDSANVTLSASATNAITDGDANLTVYRPLSMRSEDGTHFTWSLTSRDSGTYSILSADGSWLTDIRGTKGPKAGQPVWLFSSLDGDQFGGRIDRVDQENLSGKVPIRRTCQCVSWDSLLDQRIVTPFGSPYTGYTLGTLGAKLVYDHATAEGIVVVAVAGPSLDPWSGTYQMTVGQALDDICAKASGATTTYAWRMDIWRTVHIFAKTTTVAPWNVSRLDGSDGNALIAVKAAKTLAKLANRVYADTDQLLSAPVTNTFTGDGSTKTFGLTGPVGVPPTITVNGSGVTVGVLGVDTGKSWYWSPGGSTVAEDPGLSPLTGVDTLEVTFQTVAKGQSFYQYNTGVGSRADIEGGTGYHDVDITVPGPITQAALDSIAQATAETYGVESQEITIQSFRGGLTIGELWTVNLLEFDIADVFLIDQIQLDTTPDNVPYWTYHAISGPLIGDAITALINLSNSSGGGSGVSGGSGGGTGGTGSVTTQTVIVAGSSPTVSPSVAPVDNAVLIVFVEQGTPGYAVNWDSSFEFVMSSTVSTADGTKSALAFAGRAGKWRCFAAMTGRKA